MISDVDQRLEEIYKGLQIEHQANKTYTVSALVRNIQAADPGLWENFKGHLYSNADAWEDPRAISISCCKDVRQLVDVVLKKIPQDKVVDTSDIYEAAMIACLWRKYNFPCFFLTEEILHAALNTDLPEYIDWTKINLPFETAAFIFPKDSIKSVLGGNISYVKFGRIRSGQEYEVFPGQPQKTRYNLRSKDEAVNHTNCYFKITALDRDHMLDYSRYFKNAYDVKNDFDFDDDSKTWNTNDEVLFTKGAGAEQFSVKITKDDREFSHNMVKIVHNVLMIMNLRPDVVESGGRTGVHKKSQREIHTPNIIGRKYKIHRSAYASGSGESTGARRLHWRRGHFREQNIGKITAKICECGCEKINHDHNSENKLACIKCDCKNFVLAISVYEDKKTIWIEPILVGAHEEK